MKLRAVSRLVSDACRGAGRESASPSDAAQSKAPTGWIGWRYVDVPQDVQLLGRDEISGYDTTYQVVYFTERDRGTVWLARGPAKGMTGMTGWTVIAAITLNVGVGEQFLIGGCRVNGTHDQAIVAVALVEDVPLLTHVNSAWRVNPTKPSFDSVDVAPITCVNSNIESHTAGDSITALRPPFSSAEASVEAYITRNRDRETLVLSRCALPTAVTCTGGVEVLTSAETRVVSTNADQSVVEVTSFVVARIASGGSDLQVFPVAPPEPRTDSMTVRRAGDGTGWDAPMPRANGRTRTSLENVRTETSVAREHFELNPRERGKLDSIAAGAPRRRP